MIDLLKITSVFSAPMVDEASRGIKRSEDNA